MSMALGGLGHPGLHVTVFDPDMVTPSNAGRQLFSPSDTGLNKAVCLVSRINRYMGTAWEAIPEAYMHESHPHANIYITCTDNISSRTALWDELRKHRKDSGYTSDSTPLYWLDFGNARTTGQAVIGTVRNKNPQPESGKYKTAEKLKTVTELFDYTQVRDEDSGPACSLAEALEKQDLFVNSTLAQLGCALLWKMFTEGMLHVQGLFLNLDTMNVNPMEIQG